MQTADMTKDRVIRFRADDTDHARLDALASHFGAPAATVIRILIKEKYDALSSASAAPALLDEEHKGVLGALRRHIELTREELTEEAGITSSIAPRVLNELRRWGLVSKKGGQYTLTAAGKAR